MKAMPREDLSVTFAFCLNRAPPGADDNRSVRSKLSGISRAQLMASSGHTHIIPLDRLVMDPQL